MWALLPFLLLLLAVSFWQQAPERLPTHWSSDRPDGFASGAEVFAVAVSVSGACAALAALTSVLAGVLPAFWGRWIVTLLAGVGATAAAVYVVTVWASDQAGSPERVHVIWPIVPFLLGLVWAAIAYLLHRPEVVDRAAVIDTIPERSRVVPVRADADRGHGTGRAREQEGPWATSVRSNVLLGTAVFVLVILGVSAVLAGASSILGGLVVGLVALVSAAYTAAWSRIEVRVGQEGLQIRSQLLPLTLTRIAATEVVGVQTLDLDPMKWGGMGLRWLPDRTAYIVRGGPGIVVHRASGRRFAIEVPEGEAVADAGTRALLRVAGQAMSVGGSS